MKRLFCSLKLTICCLMKNIFTYPTALLLGLGLLAAPKADAQQFSKRKKYNTIGFSLNAMNYFGDVTPTTSFTSLRFGATRPNVGVSISRRFYPRISGKLALSYGRITGDDALSANQNDPNARFRYNRNMSFQNDILELAGTVVIDLIENRNNYLKRPDFVPFVFVGVAGFYHNPKGLYRDGTYVALSDLHTEGQSSSYSTTQFSIPFGGGVRYRINRNFDAALEIGWRKTFTDYLDDVSGNYAPAGSLITDKQIYFGGGNPIATGNVATSGTFADPILGGNGQGITRTRTTDITGKDFTGFDNPGAKRGTDDKTDWYIITGISLNYILNPKIKNPKFR